MMGNHLFINKSGDEMGQPVLNLKTVKLSEPQLLSPSHLPLLTAIQPVMIICSFTLKKTSS